MTETFDIFTLLVLVVAVVIFLRLRSVLGRRTGHERPPVDPYSSSENNQEGRAIPPQEQGSAQGGVVKFPRGEAFDPSEVSPLSDDVIEEIKKIAPDGSALAKGLSDIVEADHSFHPAQFVEGAKKAYEMIIKAFAESDKRALKPLLHKDVYDGFISVIGDREDRGETVVSHFVGFQKADIIEAELKNKTVQITVKFVSELITAVCDRAGEVIEGDPKKVREVIDIWTFAREVISHDPNWKLIATESAN